MRTISLSEYVREIEKEEARMEGEFEKALQVAQQLLVHGISPEINAESAGLSLDKVQGLVNKEAYKTRTIPLREYVRELDKVKARVEGELKKALEVARQLLVHGISLELIAESTGLSLDEVKGL
jgi:predicted transposase YdaD